MRLSPASMPPRPTRPMPKPSRKLGASEGALGAALGRLFALSEAYPDLKANQNMMQLQEELASTENKVAFSRQAFNDSVTGLQQHRREFPEQRHRRHVQFPTRELPRDRRTEEKREAPEVSFT